MPELKATLTLEEIDKIGHEEYVRDYCSWHWDDVMITRIGTHNGRHFLRISQGDNSIEVYISKTGKSIRCFEGKGSKEMKASG